MQLVPIFNPTTFNSYVPYSGALTDIDLGTKDITTTGDISAGVITGVSCIISQYIGLAADTDLISLASGALTINGTLGAGAITGTSLALGSGNITTTGTITTPTTITASGTISAEQLTSTDDITLTGLLTNNGDGTTTGGIVSTGKITITGVTGSAGLTGSIVNIVSGTGGAKIGGAGGKGGNFSFTSGTGGANVNTGYLSGDGGSFSLTSGSGGDPSGSGAGSAIGGQGGDFALISGAGGNSFFVSSSINTGGNGGDFTFTSGSGGAALGGTSNGGNGGDIIFSTGTSGGGTALDGQILLFLAGNRKITITTTALSFIDNYKTIFGTGANATIYYDRTDFNFNAAEVGTGGFKWRTAANTDLVFTFVGTTNSGILTWMEDEDRFQFADAILCDLTLGITGLTTCTGGITTASSRQIKCEVVTTTATVATTSELTVCNSASNFALTLPAATGGGRKISIKNINTGTVTVTADTSGTADDIDGSATVNLIQWESITVVDYNTGTGNKWVII